MWLKYNVIKIEYMFSVVCEFKLEERGNYRYIVRLVSKLM